MPAGGRAAGTPSCLGALTIPLYEPVDSSGELPFPF